MNEKLNLGIAIGFIATVSFGGMLLSMKPVPLITHQQNERITQNGVVGQPREAEPTQTNKKPAEPTPMIANREGAPDANAKGGCLPDEKPSECRIRQIQDRSATFNEYLVGVGLLQVFGLAFGVIVYWYQARIMRRTFISTHRPRLRIRHIQFWGGAGYDHPHSMRYTIVNVGGSNATIINRTDMTSKLLPQFGLQRYPTYGPSSCRKKVELGAGIAYFFESVDAAAFDKHDLGAIERGELILHCSGLIIYRDELGLVRRTGFSRLFDPKSLRFRPVDDPEHEYED